MCDVVCYVDCVTKLIFFYIQTCWVVKQYKFAFVCSNVPRNVACCVCHGPHNLRVSQLRQHTESKVLLFTW